jgi:predicted phosphodiesterase
LAAELGLNEEQVRVIGGNTDRYLVEMTLMKQKPAENADAYAALLTWRRVMTAQLLWTGEQLSFDDYQYLAKLLRRELHLTVEGYGDVIGYHGGPDDDEHFLRPDTTDEAVLDALFEREGRLALGGHTHQAMDRTVGRWRVVNPGSVGLAPTAQWAYLTFAAGEVQVDLRQVAYDTDAALAELAAVGFPDAQRLATWFGKGGA